MLSSLVWQVLDPIIHRTQGKHANHYTTDVIPLYFDNLYIGIVLIIYSFAVFCITEHSFFIWIYVDNVCGYLFSIAEGNW
jgi:hypothetical protein